MKRRIGVVAAGVLLTALSATPASAADAAQEAQLFSPQPQADEAFGRGLAVEGDTVVAGAPSAASMTVQETRNGAAYVFVRSGAGFALQQELVRDDPAGGDSFGTSVALSGDTALVSARLDDNDKGVNAGAVYVFVRSGTTWTQQAKLLAGDGQMGDQFGLSVDLEGDTAVVGAFTDDTDGGANTGSARVFTRSGTTWTEQATLLPDGAAAGDLFGRAVSVSGNTALVGGDGDDVTTSGGEQADAGSAVVFLREGTTWTQQAQLVAPDAAADNLFGVDVSLDGDTALIGAPENEGRGAAYVFVRSGTTWSPQAKLVAAATDAADEFGDNVAIIGDTSVVGAPTGEDSAGVAKGVATVFLRSGTSWREDVSFSPEQAKAGDLVSFPTAFDGTRVVVGAIRDDTQGNNAGSAYVYRLDQPPAPVIPEVPYAALLPLAALGVGALAARARWAAQD